MMRRKQFSVTLRADGREFVRHVLAFDKDDAVTVADARGREIVKVQTRREYEHTYDLLQKVARNSEGRP